ncbi:MAG: tetratricopeptide repeat protein [Xanthobacteraceae bacterium]
MTILIRMIFTVMMLMMCAAVSAEEPSTVTPTSPASDAAAYIAEAKQAEKRLDFSEAASWYQKAGELGDAESMYELGWIYFGSHDIPGRHLKDYAKAAIWFQKAADLNYAPAMTQLGVMYGADGSFGVPEDHAKAAQLYLKAAQMGDAYAMNHLGYVYSHGIGVPKDIDKAVFWWKKAVAAGGEPGKAAQTWLDVLNR